MKELLLENTGVDLSIDLTPLVDVLFMLLIFFILSFTFEKQAIDINLASTESATNGNSQTKKLIIAINKTGEIFLDDQKINMKKLETIFINERQKTVSLFVDRESPFQAFMSVMDLARQCERDDLVVITEYHDD